MATIVEEGSPETVVNSYNFLISKLNDRENKMTVSNKERRAFVWHL